MLFEDEKIYTSKDVISRVKICRETLTKYCKKGLRYFVLPGAKERRFYGSDLNQFFGGNV